MEIVCAPDYFGIQVEPASVRGFPPASQTPTITIFATPEQPLDTQLCPGCHSRNLNGQPTTTMLRGSATLLITEKDEIGPAADSKLAQQVRYMKFYGTFGDVELVSNLLVGQIFKQ
jgi:hypothetical protein